jgi:hypothetical protein
MAVQLRLTTIRGSAVLQDLGLSQLPQTLDEQTTRRLELAVKSALNDLIAGNLVRLVGVVAERQPRTQSRVNLRVDWVDLTDQSLNQTII